MTLSPLVLLAAEPPAADAGLFGALGINWQLLLIQIIAFLILVFLLGKFVYPWLMKQVDERQENIEKAAKAAVDAQKAVAASEEEIAGLLDDARREAAEIVTTAKDEAAEIMSLAEKKSRQEADRIIADAEERLEKDILAARDQLKQEMATLIATATAQVTKGHISPKANDALIADALKELR